jgi:hypothetical protein
VIVQPLAVLGEGRRVERVLARMQVEEPAIHQVHVDLFAQLPFAADRIEGLQQQGFEQPFRRHARPTGLTVRRGKGLRQAGENAVGPAFDVSQRMVGPNAILDLKDMKQRHLPVRFATHNRLPVNDAASLARENHLATEVFPQPVKSAP